MTVWAYSRVSTTRQANEGESLDVQQRVMAGYAMMHGLTVDKTLIDGGVSGSTPLGERPEGSKLLSGIQAGDIVLCAKLDRMFRSALDALDTLKTFQRIGVSLHLIDLGGDVTGNGISKLVFTILAAVAEAERDRIRERITVVKQDQKQRGRYLGGKVPVGAEVDELGNLRTSLRQDIATSVRGWRDDGMSLRAIAAKVEQDFGVRISKNAVARMLG